MVGIEQRSLYRFPVAITLGAVGDIFACHPTDSALEYAKVSVLRRFPYSTQDAGAKISVGHLVDGVVTKLMDDMVIDFVEKGVLDFGANLQPLAGPIVVGVESIIDGAPSASFPVGIEVLLTLYFITQQVK